MVHINREEIEERYRDLKEEMTRVVEEKMLEIIAELNHHVNQRLNRFSRIHQFVLQPVPLPENTHPEDQEVSLLLSPCHP
ncbi:MAG: hypothetical protein ACOC5F_05335 [Candidatus Aminicenantaceae bacterium]